MAEINTDILIVGGSLGGVAAALSAARLGYQVVLTEETDWIGGQLTSQAVPMDEHPWIESFGCTQSYRSLREGLRDYYRRHYPLTATARADRHLNPGASLVTRVSGEPRAWVAVLESMLAPYLANGQVMIWRQTKPVKVERDGERVRAVTLRGVDGDETAVTAAYVLDATELGDLLPLAGVSYVTGAESQAQTGEPHALPEADPLRMQGFTWVFALDYRPGEDHTIAKPDEYDFWRTYQAEFETGPHLSLNPRPSIDYQFFPDEGLGKFSLWQFRRILYRGNFEPGFLASDVTLINCTQNDYWLGPLIEVPEAEAQYHKQRSRNLSLSLLYWLQTEVPRPDGGYGYPGLRLRPDITGTKDGFAKHPYIRESRRITAEFTVVEQHVVGSDQNCGPVTFEDSVGIGSYMVDIHASVGGHRSSLGYTVSRPFEIPLGALIHKEVDNLLPACKNLGVTHITNGCFRLHPVEWNVGESAGALAAFCLRHKLTPRQVRNQPEQLQAFQQMLARLGIELHWPNPQNGMSYYRWASRQPHWDWGETDRRTGSI